MASKIFKDAAADSARMGYPEISDAVEHAIASGALRSGERLPTQREVAKELGIAIGTVTRAYSELERRGMIVGLVGRGTFVSSYADPQLRDVQGLAGPALIDMTISRPPPEGAARHFANALRQLSKRRDLIELLGTEPPNGWLKHRFAIAKWISTRGSSVDDSHVIICNGVQHALSVIFSAFTEPGDVIATEELNYSGIKLLSDLHSIQLIGVPLDQDGLRADRLEQVCREHKVKFVLCSPTAHNPTTISMSMQRRRQLVALSQKYGFLIIENDILGMMPANPRPPIHAIAPRGVIYVTGLTKVTAAGMRLGFIVAPPSLLQPLMSGVRSTTWMPNPLTLEIFTLWVEDKSIDEIISWHRAEIEARWEIARTSLTAMCLRADPCSYHVWLDLPFAWNPDDFVAAAHARGVSLSPSDTFALDAGSAPNAVRISLGFPNSREALTKALAILGQMLREKPGSSVSSRT